MAYFVTIDTEEKKALVDLLGLHVDVIRTNIMSGGLPMAKQIREEWSVLVVGLIMESLPRQLTELYRHTERVFTAWEEALIPGYQKRQPSLDEAVAQSESDLEKWVRRLHQQKKSRAK